MKHRLGIAIEWIGSILDRIPAWPWYRSKKAIATLDAEEAEMYAEYQWGDPDDEHPRKQWFGVIGGWGCRLGICRVGIDWQEDGHE